MNFNEPNSMMKSVLSFSIVFFSGFFIHAQTYTDYLGAGHNAGITVTASSEMQRNAWNEKAAAANTVNGKGLDSRLLETSRFLAQATFGCPLGYIQSVAAGCYEQWIDDQFTRHLHKVLPEFMNRPKQCILPMAEMVKIISGPLWYTSSMHGGIIT